MLQAPPKASPVPHVQLHTWTGCSSAEGNMTCPQQLARASRLHDRAGKGTGAATEASSSSLASTGSVGSGEGPGTGSPRARRVTLGQPCSQPVCARPSGSQQSRSGRLGWRRRQDWPGSQHRTDLFPQFIWPPPYTPKQYGLASARREVGNKPPPKQL